MPEYKVRQLNCGKRTTATDNIRTWKDTQIVLLQEPNCVTLRSLRQFGNIYSLPLARAAICIKPGIDSTLMSDFSDRDVTTIQLEGQRTIICSAYLDIKTAAWPALLYNLVSHCQTKNLKLILGIDTNAHSSLWGCVDQNARGDSIETAIIRHNLFVHNNGSKYTFDGGVGRSIIDVTLSNSPNCVTGWRVLDECSFSDHNIIEFALDGVTDPKVEPSRNLKHVDWKQMASVVDGNLPPLPERWTPETLDETALLFQKIYLENLNAAAPLQPRAKRYANWWNEDCTVAKNKCRKAERFRRRLPTKYTRQRESSARKEYTKAIFKAKKTSWQKFIESVADESEAAKINKIMRNANGPTPELGLVQDTQGKMTQSKTETLEVMLAEHFPGSEPWQPSDSQNSKSSDVEISLSWLTPARFKAATKAFKTGKAPGPDEIRSEFLRVCKPSTISLILHMYNASIRLNHVPDVWRQVKVIFIPKPGKPDYSARRAFRPISLMSVMFKTLERLVLWHIEKQNLKKHPIHRLQFGFRKGRSTEHAISKAVNIIEKGIEQKQYVLGVFCDIAGAFDNANLSSITDCMRDRKIDENIIGWYEHFLKDRKVVSSLGTAMAAIKPGKGTPQGGVLSAIISWNLIFDDLLRRFDKTSVTSIGFADDGTLLIKGPVIADLYRQMNGYLDIATDWATEHGLKFCPNKTSAVLFTRRKVPKELPTLYMYGEPIPHAKQAKVLGVTLDSTLSWTPHITAKISQCKKALMQLLPIMRRTWSPKPKYTRWLYKDVILPMLLYGSHVWQHKINNTTIYNKLMRLQRLGMMSVTHVRKSTPTAALELLYDLPPIHLAIKERAINTASRLHTLHQEGDWLPINDKNMAYTERHFGHLRRLRRMLPANFEPITMEHEENFENNFEVYIDNELRIGADFSVYTDGSLIEERSGAGAYIVEKAEPLLTISENLPDCTVFQAELRAIRTATQHLMQIACPKDASVTFFVDSQAALKALTTPYVDNLEVLNTISILNSLGRNNIVKLQWIKAHVGYHGNEAADRAAKEGAFSTRAQTTDLTDSKQAIKAYSRHRRNVQWNNEWLSRADCRQSKLFLPTRENKVWNDIKDLPNPKASRIIRFLTGHTFMNRQNAIVKLGKDKALESDDVYCSLCMEEEETPAHLIQECPCLNQLRLNTLYAWKLDTPPPWSEEVKNFILSDAIKSLESDRSTSTRE